MEDASNEKAVLYVRTEASKKKMLEALCGPRGLNKWVLEAIDEKLERDGEDIVVSEDRTVWLGGKMLEMFEDMAVKAGKSVEEVFSETMRAALDREERRKMKATSDVCPACGGMILVSKAKKIRYCRKQCGWEEPLDG